MKNLQVTTDWNTLMASAGWKVVPDFHLRRPAAMHVVRSALPAVHARALKAHSRWGPCWPRRVWQNLHDKDWLAFEWRRKDAQPVFGLVRDDQAGIIPMDAWRWKQHQANRPPAAPALPQPPAGGPFIDFESHFVAEWLPMPTSPAAPAASTVKNADVGKDARLKIANGAEAEVMQGLDATWPVLPGDSSWTRADSPLEWRIPSNSEQHAIYAVLRTDAPANFTLPAPPDGKAVKLAVRDTPFYEKALLVRLVDLRGERTRITYFLTDLSCLTLLALRYESTQIFDFNRRLASENRLRIDARTCAEYVRFFCEFVHADGGAFVILWSANDMDWLDETFKEEDQYPIAAIKPPRLRFLQPPRVKSGATQTHSGPRSPVVALCLAHINYDRYVFVAGLEIHTDGMVYMPEDQPIQDGDWRVAPTLFDDEFAFHLSEPRVANHNVKRRDARASRRSTHDNLPAVLRGLPTGPGELDPCRLRRHIEIHDAIDLRGHEMAHALLIYDVVFWGRVDLRSVTVKGDVDLTRCVFQEGLLLDDAEIQGSLVLHRMSASQISLRGVQVQGRLDLSEAQLKGSVTAGGADVQGDLDARGLSGSTLWMTGLKLRGDLLLGCSKALRRGVLNKARLMAIVGRNANVEGSVGIMQPGHRPDMKLNREERKRELRWDHHVPKIDFTNATIKGSFSLRPNRNPIKEDAEPSYEPALGCHNLLLRGARIDGDVEVQAALVEDCVDASHAEVGGDLNVLGVWVRGCAKLHDMRVAGWVRIASYISPLKKSPLIWPVTSCFECGLDLALSHVARLVLEGIDCRGDLGLWSIRSASMVRLITDGDVPCRVRARLPLGEKFEEAYDGNLIAYGLNTLQFELTGVDVEGDIILKGVDLLELICRPGLLHKPEGLDKNLPETSLLLPRCAFFSMVNARVRGNVELVCIQVSGAHSKGKSGLLMHDSEIGGELVLAQSDRIDRLFLEPRQKEENLVSPVLFHGRLVSAIAEAIIIERCTVGAQLNLTGTQADEGISLEDSRLKGDLLIKAVSKVPYARAASLNLRMLHCANDVDLTGLILGYSGTTSPQLLLSASHAEITADVRLCSDDVRTHARIHGDIDFSFAKLAHLVVHSAVIATPDAQLILRHAQIARMEIPSDEADMVSLPDTRLKGTSIELWDPKIEPNDLITYHKLLDSDKDCSPEAVAALERRLRLDGLTPAADSVYRYGYHRQFTKEIGPLAARLHTVSHRVKSLAVPHNLMEVFTLLRACASFKVRTGLHGLFKATLGFGTQIVRLLAILIVLALLALPITLSSNNFEASLAALAVQQERLEAHSAHTDIHKTPTPAPIVKGSLPPSGEWGFGDALQIMLKNWLPMLPLHARDDWQPRDDGATALIWNDQVDCRASASPTLFKGCLPGAPENWLNFMQLACWMGWPLLLTMFIRRILRN